MRTSSTRAVGEFPLPTDGVRRSFALIRAFRVEQSNPSECYRILAADAVAQLSRHTNIAGALVLDVGGGPGYFADAVASAGGRCITVDASPPELSLHDRSPGTAVVASGTALPLHEGTIDLCCSFNTIEHVAKPRTLLNELVRVTRPGGVIHVSLTNWLSPWGGHETSPWHYLGGQRAALHYEARHRKVPKNRFGESLFVVSVAEVLRWVRQDVHLELIDARPRYYPTWCRWLVRVPAVREIATWNLSLVLGRR
jgi:ubiquinone/menaquinone biosynthesis C-methylase UbiE